MEGRVVVRGAATKNTAGLGIESETVRNLVQFVSFLLWTSQFWDMATAALQHGNSERNGLPTTKRFAVKHLHSKRPVPWEEGKEMCLSNRQRCWQIVFWVLANYGWLMLFAKNLPRHGWLHEGKPTKSEKLYSLCLLAAVSACLLHCTKSFNWWRSCASL